MAFFFFGALEMIRLLLWMIICQCNFESKLVSYERCIAFEEIQPEKMYTRFAEESKHLDSMANGKYKSTHTAQEIATEGAIKFTNVSCRYNERSDLVIKNLSFELKPKEKIGIIGRSGAGKSTLIKLMWLCIRPCEGQILIDGTDISETDLKDWRSQVMVISQDTCLFEGSLKENIDPLNTMGDDEKLNQILKRLNFMHKDYETHGLKMQIEADGGNLSQGEKQLICFSRTLVTRKKILIFDEATANIDLKTEETIQKEIKQEFGECTMMIIAHRIQTIIHCDKIMVMDGGMMVEFDTPKNLLKTEGSYFKEIYEKSIKESAPS